MKRVLFLVFGLSLFLKADIVEDNINLIKNLSNKQDLVANTVELYIELYGTKPTDINDLKSANLLDSSFNYNGSFSVGTNSITVTTSYSNAETYQEDFYSNNFARGRVVEPSVSGSNFITKYYLTKEALNSIYYEATSNYVTPVEPSSPSSGQLWYDTRRKTLFFYTSGAWRNLNVKKLWIVKDTVELPTNATENDGAIVLTTTTLNKYLYVGSSWYLIPQNIPFNYNGSF